MSSPSPTTFYLTSSCVMGTFAPAVEPLVARVYDLLGRRWAMGGTGAASLNTCCSGIVTHGNVFTVESSLLVVARLWSVCAEAGLENITTVCVTSFAMHNEILELLHKEPGLPRRWTRPSLTPRAAADPAEQHRALQRRLLPVPGRSSRAHEVPARRQGTGRPLKGWTTLAATTTRSSLASRWAGPSTCDVLAAMIREWGGDEVDYPNAGIAAAWVRQCMIRPNRSFTVACARKKSRAWLLSPPTYPHQLPRLQPCPRPRAVGCQRDDGRQIPDPCAQLRGAGRPASRLGPVRRRGAAGPHRAGGAAAGTDRNPQSSRPAYLRGDAAAPSPAARAAAARVSLGTGAR